MSSKRVCFGRYVPRSKKLHWASLPPPQAPARGGHPNGLNSDRQAEKTRAAQGEQNPVNRKLSFDFGALKSEPRQSDLTISPGTKTLRVPSSYAKNGKSPKTGVIDKMLNVSSFPAHTQTPLLPLIELALENDITNRNIEVERKARSLWNLQAPHIQHEAISVSVLIVGR